MPSSISNPHSSHYRQAHGRIRRAPLTRSSSILGTIKNIVTAPLSWFGSSEDYEDVQGKRRRNPFAGEGNDRETEGGERSNKRKRLHSPVKETYVVQQYVQPAQMQHLHPGGYLDVPSTIIAPSAAPSRGFGASDYVRSSSLAVPSVSRQQQRRISRHSLSPQPSGSYTQPSALARTQSMDPPMRGSGLTRDPSLVPLPISRDVSMEAPFGSSPVRDASMSPSRARFRMRTSLTPQPSGQSFGPSLQRRPRDPSEPPPLQALMSNPIFVKSPTEVGSESQGISRSATLGSLLETQRVGAPLTRQRSSLLIGSQSTSDVASGSTPMRAINAAEIALHELDVYKTPLLPSRLRGSTTIPDMFKPKKVHAPVLMRGDREDRPRLGKSEKLGAKHKEEEEGKVVKPYAGQGGMKKLLARRRMEEEEEKEKEREAAIVTDDEEQLEHAKAEVPAGILKESEPKASWVPPPVGGREVSSLRVGRTRTSRNHIQRPISKSKNRFSAIYDDEDMEDQMDEGEKVTETMETPTKAPAFEPPPGFSFAKDTKPIQHDTAGAKEPPIFALPFAIKLERPSKPATTEPAPAPSPPIPKTVAADSTLVSAPAPPTPLFASVPSIALIPPSPGQPAPAAAPPKPAAEQLGVSVPRAGPPSIPNFFANSSYLKDTTATPIPSFVPPTTSTLPSPTKPAKADEGAGVSGSGSTSVPNFFANSSYLNKPSAPAPTTFSLVPSTSEKEAPSVPSTTEALAAQPSVSTTSALAAAAPIGEKKPAPTSLFGGTTSAEASKLTPSSLFGGTGTRVPVSVFGTSTSSAFGAPSTAAPPKETPAAPQAPAATPFLFGTPAKPAETPASQPFPFGVTPTPAPDKAAPTSQPFSFGAPAKPSEPSPPAFSFGPPKTDTTKEAPTASETPKSPSLFGQSAPPTPFGGFGSSAPSTAAPAVEPSKSAFTFGPPSTPSTPTVETPKGVFGAPFTFGQPSTTPTPDVTSPAKSPFSFGAAPSTPTAEKKTPFTFGAPAPPSGGSMLFGTPSGSNAADVSNKPFAFGATPARPVTPPRIDTEVQMDESPMRGAGMDLNGNGKQREQPKALSAFGYGAPVQNAPFGQPTTSSSQPFAFGASSSASPFGAKLESKAEEKQAMSFGAFGQASSASGFFGSKPVETQATSSAFTFGQPSSTPTTTTAPFSFGAPSVNTNAFSRPSTANGSAPASPLTFNPPSTFGFGAQTPATAAPNAFNFGGSQPASPAASNAGLPSAGASSGAFTFGQSGAAPGSSPSSFGAPAPLPAPGGGALFTMGSAPPPSTTGPGGRPLKKLPSRRGAKR